MIEDDYWTAIILGGFAYLLIAAMHVWQPIFLTGERLVYKAPTKDARFFVRFWVFWLWPLLYVWVPFWLPYRLLKGGYHLLKGAYDLIPKKAKLPRARIISDR